LARGKDFVAIFGDRAILPTSLSNVENSKLITGDSNVAKKTSSQNTKPLKTSNQTPTPASGESVEMMLVPSGFARTSPALLDFRLIATKSPGARVAGPNTPAPSRAGVGLPVFTLVPRLSYESKSTAEDVQPQVEHRTRPYGGHDLIISGSMSDGTHEQPSFTLAPTAKRIQRPSKPYTKTKRK
jgi:hypothetical protein